MINNIVELFKTLFSSCLSFTDIVLMLSAVSLIAVVVTVFKYILRGRY